MNEEILDALRKVLGECEKELDSLKAGPNVDYVGDKEKSCKSDKTDKDGKKCNECFITIAYTPGDDKSAHILGVSVDDAKKAAEISYAMAVALGKFIGKELSVNWEKLTASILKTIQSNVTMQSLFDILEVFKDEHN